MSASEEEKPGIKICDGTSTELLHAIEDSGLWFEVVEEFDQSEFESFDVLMALCQSGLDMLGDDADDQSGPPFPDPFGGTDFFTGLTMHLSDIDGALEPLRDIEPVKQYQMMNQAPASQRREGKRAKHIRAKMRGKKK